MDFIF
ncbi:hypothetical protein VULLAG_LOCUS22144 [Vulpes lagopus]